jgi:hypothetical protein
MRYARPVESPFSPSQFLCERDKQSIAHLNANTQAQGQGNSFHALVAEKKYTESLGYSGFRKANYFSVQNRVKRSGGTNFLSVLSMQTGSMAAPHIKAF